jgi:hypothetical protein
MLLGKRNKNEFQLGKNESGLQKLLGKADHEAYMAHIRGIYTPKSAEVMNRRLLSGSNMRYAAPPKKK